MANAIQRLAARVFGLATQDELLSLQTRMRRGNGIASGVEIQQGRFDYETNTKWTNSTRFDTLDSMEGDPHVKDVLDAAILPLITGKWEVQPASDSARDKEIAEFVTANLLRQTTDRYGREYWCDTPHDQRVREECDALRVGYSLFVPTWRRVGSKYVYGRIQWLEPDTIDPYKGWELDEADQIVAIRRQYRTPNGYFETGDRITADRIRLFVWDGKGARYEGRSMLRSVYGAWFRKDFFLRQAMAWAQKVGSPVPVGFYPDTWDKTAIDNFEDFIKSMRGTAPVTAFGMFPRATNGTAAEISFAGLEGANDVDRMRGNINGENAEIAHVGKTKSKLLGETATGSRAVGSEQSEDEDLFRQAVAQWVCNQENDGYSNLDGLVEPLVMANFANVKDCPKVVVSRIGPKEDRTAVTPLIQVWSSQAPIEVKREATERLGFHFDEEFYEKQEQEAEEAKEMLRESMEGDGGSQDAPNKDAEDEADREALSLSVPPAVRERVARLLAAKEGAVKIGNAHRAPNVLETSLVQLAAVQKSMDDGTRDLHQDLRVIRDDMVRDLMSRLRSGKVTRRNLDSQRRSKFRGQMRAEKRLLDTLSRIGNEGAVEVVEELDRAAR